MRKYVLQFLGCLLGNAILNFLGAILKAFSLWSDDLLKQEVFWDNVRQCFVANYWHKDDFFSSVLMLIGMAVAVVVTLIFVNWATSIDKKLG